MENTQQETLSTNYKILVVLGELLLTPLLGAALYYAWKKDYPRKARFANISSWCVVAFYIFGLPTLLSGVGSLFQQHSTSSDMARVHPDEREVMRAIYDGIAGFETDDEGHVTTVQYAPMEFMVTVGDKELSRISQFPHLKNLIFPMVGSEISDEGLRKLSQLGELEVLMLHMAEGVTNEGMQALSALSHLKGLGIAGTSVDDEGMNHVGQLRELEFLDATGIELTDAGIRELAGLQNLKSLSVVSTGITDASMETIANFPHLEELDIRGCDVTDDGLKTLAQSKTLKSLVAFQTENGGGLITKAGLKHLQKIETLKRIDVRGIDLSDAEAASLREAFADCEILIEDPDA